MQKHNTESLRILIDLLACQGGNAERGIGRYTASMFSEFTTLPHQHAILPIIFNGYTQSLLPAIVNDKPLTIPQLPDWRVISKNDVDPACTLTQLTYSACVAPLRYDILHVSNVFEEIVPSHALKSREQILSATIYDLIPLVFSEHYFSSASFRITYLNRLAWVRSADLLLTISEATRRDIINFLGIEPWRIVTIHGGIPCQLSSGDSLKNDDILNKFGIVKPFLLYTGGDEFRKNIDGAIRAFAILPSDIRKRHQFIIVCALSKQSRERYLRLMHACGLSSADVVFTGFISDDELAVFYQSCLAFVFPSRYEGFGLPILEAMRYGAPVIGSDNSSIAEIIANKDALFNVDVTDDVARVMHRVIVDKGFAASLREKNVDILRKFTFRRTAELAMGAFEEAVARKRHASLTCMIEGCLPKKRLAYLTPLPPSHSGIAHYSAEQLLPWLIRYFDIDVYIDAETVSDDFSRLSCRVFHHRDFSNMADSYDYIVYAFGNSTFHSHMFTYLKHFPGVVVLHDLHLGGVTLDMSYLQGGLEYFEREMLYAHGPIARRHLLLGNKEKNAIYQAIVSLPCCKRVLDQAVGVIVHSKHNTVKIRKYFPEGVAAPVRIVPQPLLPNIASPKTKALKAAAIKGKNGIPDNAFVFAAFGHIAAIKHVDLIIDAFMQGGFADTYNVHLVFVGKHFGDDFAEALLCKINVPELQGKIIVTGYVNNADYFAWLHAVDVAIQLRQWSMGETSKAVLDCFANGVPIIMNNLPGFCDYPESVVRVIGHPVKPDELASAMHELRDDEAQRRTLSKTAADYIHDHHAPASCAAQYAAVIREAYSRHDCVHPTMLSKAFAPSLAECPKAKRFATQAASFLGEIGQYIPKRRKIIFDVSATSRSDSMTGVTRSVTELARHLYCMDRCGVEPVAARRVGNKLFVATDWLDSLDLLLKSETTDVSLAHQEVCLESGDIFLLCDASWDNYLEYNYIFEAARYAGAQIILVVYDLLPLMLPGMMFPQGAAKNYGELIKFTVSHSDMVLGISQAALNEIKDWIERELPEIAWQLRYGYWPLGSDAGNMAIYCGGAYPQYAVNSHALDKPFLLMVGTIAPHKNQYLALKAMDLLWERDFSLCLCIAGKEGWLVDDLMHRLRDTDDTHLVFVDSPSDAELAWLYANAQGLLSIAANEGFGLPLIEAASCGTPIVCSDIPVFREIAGNCATYVRTNDAACLANDIEAWWKQANWGTIPDSSKIPRLTWEESTNQLLDAILNHHEV